MNDRTLSRRRFLRASGLAGLTLALPPLELLVRPQRAYAAGTPRKLVIFHFPNGAYMRDWLPDVEGTDYPLPDQLEPLADLRDDFVLATGLSSISGGELPCGFGSPHIMPTMSMLAGTTIDCDREPQGPSIDHAVAGRLAPVQRPVIVTKPYSWYPQFRVSFTDAGPGTGVDPVTRPSVLFDQLFAAGVDPQQAEAIRQRRLSVLDFVREDARDLEARLGVADRRRLDLHLEAIRELELRATLQPPACTAPEAPTLDDEDLLYDQIPARAELLMDLSLMALRCDISHVLTYSIGTTQATVEYPFLPDGNPPIDVHQVSHLQAGDEPGDETAVFWYKEVTKWHMGMFARLLEAMKADADLGESLLDRSLVAGLSEMSIGGIHHPYNLPVLLAGNGLEGGRHVHFPCSVQNPSSNNWGYDSNSYGCQDEGETPLANLWLTMLRAFGAGDESFGESTGVLDGLWS